MNIKMHRAPGMGPKPQWEEWADKRPYLTIKQRPVYLYLREKAARSLSVDLKTMGRELGTDYAKRLWESKGAMTQTAIKDTIRELEELGLLSFDGDEERLKVLGEVSW